MLKALFPNLLASKDKLPVVNFTCKFSSTITSNSGKETVKPFREVSITGL